MRFIRMTEHVGRPTVAKMSENTRSNLVSAPWRFLCWNMNYHAEHHYVPLVPYHTLPRLHEKLRDLIAVDELEKDWVTRVEVGRKTIAVYDTPTGIYASLALCTHGGADLCDGYFDDHVIECPLHQGAFDVRDGTPIAAPATRPMRKLEVRVREGQVQIRI